MSGEVAGLSAAERDVLWEAIDRAFLDTTTYSRASEDEIERAVERILAARLAASRDAEQAVERVRALAVRRDVAYPAKFKFGAEANYVAGYRAAQAEIRAALDPAPAVPHGGGDEAEVAG